MCSFPTDSNIYKRVGGKSCRHGWLNYPHLQMLKKEVLNEEKGSFGPAVVLFDSLSTAVWRDEIFTFDIQPYRSQTSVATLAWHSERYVQHWLPHCKQKEEGEKCEYKPGKAQNSSPKWVRDCHAFPMKMSDGLAHFLGEEDLRVWCFPPPPFCLQYKDKYKESGAGMEKRHKRVW